MGASVASLRGATRRSNPFFLYAARWIASLRSQRRGGFGVQNKKPDAAIACGFAPSRIPSALRTLYHVDIVAAGDAGVELARTADLLVRILDHLAPLADPADGAGDREQHAEHRGREYHRLQRDARIEVDVRIELAIDEVLVAERDLFQLQGDLEHRLVAVQVSRVYS